MPRNKKTTLKSLTPHPIESSEALREYLKRTDLRDPDSVAEYYSVPSGNSSVPVRRTHCSAS